MWRTILRDGPKAEFEIMGANGDVLDGFGIGTGLVTHQSMEGKKVEKQRPGGTKHSGAGAERVRSGGDLEDLGAGESRIQYWLWNFHTLLCEICEIWTTCGVYVWRMRPRAAECTRGTLEAV